MRWEFKIDNNGTLRSINPLNQRQFEIKKTLSDDYIYDWRTTMDGEFILTGGDYDYIKTLEKDFRHEKFSFKVYDTSTLMYNGEFTIHDCEFDDYTKVVKIKHTMRDQYTEIQEVEDIEVNLIAVPDEITYDRYSRFYIYGEILDLTPFPEDTVNAKLLKGVYAGTFKGYFIYCTELITLPTLILPPTGENWVQYAVLDDYIVYQRFPVNFNFDEARTVMVVYLDGDYYFNPITEIPTGGHTLLDLVIADGWEIFPLTDTETIAYKDFYISKQFARKLVRANPIITQSVLAYKLKDSITRIITQAFPTFTGSVKSTFLFNDNSDRTLVSGYSSLYNGYEKYLIEISDFKKPDAYQNATKGVTTFRKLIQYICDKLNARWFIDGNGDFRIEHYSYFDTNIVYLDKSTDNRIPQKYNYLTDKKPNREFMEEGNSWSEDFSKIQIVYGNVPAVNGIKENTNTIRLSDFYTDVDGLNSHIDQLPNDGFIYVEVSNGAVVKGTGFKSGETNLQNVELSNANCLNAYYRHNAYQDTFIIGGKSVSAESLRKMKVQKLEFMHTTFPDVTRRMSTTTMIGIFKSLSFNTVEELKFKAELHE